MDWDAVELHMAQQICVNLATQVAQVPGGSYELQHTTYGLGVAKLFVQEAKKRFDVPKSEPAQTPAADSRKILRQEDLKQPASPTTPSETVYTGVSPAVAQFIDQADKLPPTDLWREAQIKATRDMLARIRAEQEKEAAEKADLDRFFNGPHDPPDPYYQVPHYPDTVTNDR